MAAPEFLIKENQDPVRLSTLCNTTLAFAERAISYFKESISSREIHPTYTAFKRDLRAVEGNYVKSLPPDAEALWSILTPMPGKDAFDYKLCPKGFQIARDEYLKMTPCGWHIRNGIVEAYFNVA
ncbi:hypothetical protein [Methylobacterium cerastii]|uniref:hypothetical protein n=1 Tax=Methylobacterium cerastii TaxID=932741 RepID=UPI001EE23091|nr:hypothetical protein [Methylobacterium cerastii]